MGKKINKFGLITSTLKIEENQECEYNHILFLNLNLYQRSEKWKSSQCHYNSVRIFSAPKKSKLKYIMWDAISTTAFLEII